MDIILTIVKTCLLTGQKNLYFFSCELSCQNRVYKMFRSHETSVEKLQPSFHSFASNNVFYFVMVGVGRRVGYVTTLQTLLN